MASELLQLLSVSGVEEETDPFFNQVTGLYHFDGSNGGTNSTFIDSSTNGHTVTNNGDVTQGTFSPFSVADGNWSIFYNGGTDGTVMVIIVLIVLVQAILPLSFGLTLQS